MTQVDPVCRRLMTVPGGGGGHGARLLQRRGYARTLPALQSVGAHFGLVPRKYQSGPTDRNGRITKAGDAMVRTALFEAANVLLTRVARWSPLKAWAVRLAQRIGGKRAKVALARKLSVILHRIWIDRYEFRLDHAAGEAAVWTSSERRPAFRRRPCRDARTGEAAAGRGAEPAFQIGSPLRSDAIMWRQRPTTDGSMKPVGGQNEELDPSAPHYGNGLLTRS